MRGADDDRIAGDDRRGMETELAGNRVDHLIVLELQIHQAVLPEAWNRTAGLGIERNQLIALRDVENALFLPVAPVRETAAGKPARRPLGALAFVEAEHPLHLAGSRVERHHRAASPAGAVEHTVDHERRRLEVEFRLWSEIVGLEAPGHFQLVEIARR